MFIGKNIEFMRIMRELTREELADKTGLTISKIKMIEQGVIKPDAGEKEKIAKALDCRADYLTGYDSILQK